MLFRSCRSSYVDLRLSENGNEYCKKATIVNRICHTQDKKCLRTGPRPGSFCSLAVAGGLQELPAERCERGTDEGCDDEDPDLLDSEALPCNRQEHGGTEAPCGVDGGSGESDAHEVDE